MIFAVTRRRTGGWDFSKPLEEQVAWTEHAEFMDRQFERGAIALAGPLGDDRKVLIVMRADSAAEIEQLLAEDIWTRIGLLKTESVDEWTLRLGSLEGE
jgi:hypothetical protein